MAAIVLFCLALLVCIVLRTNILYALLAGLVSNGHQSNTVE